MIRYCPVYICDRCGKEADGKLPEFVGRQPQAHSHKPENWYRAYGYDLCPECGYEFEVRQRVNGVFNEATRRLVAEGMVPEGNKAHTDVWRFLWDNCRLPRHQMIGDFVKEAPGTKQQRKFWGDD